MTTLEIVLITVIYLIGYFFTVFKMNYDDWDDGHPLLWFFMLFLWVFPFWYKLVLNGLNGTFNKQW